VIVVDTSILIDHLRGDPRAHTILSDVFERHERLAASVLTKVEAPQANDPFIAMFKYRIGDPG
jgi:predicted nucleic acid-binding protein